jgi:hypothetical protein
MMHLHFAHDHTDSQPFAAVRQQHLATRISQVHLISSVPSQWQHALQLALARHSQSHTAAVYTGTSGAAAAAATAVNVAAGGKENNSLQLHQQQQQKQQKYQQQQQYVRTQLPCAQQPLSPPVWTALSSSNTAATAASSTAASAAQTSIGKLLPFDVLQMAKSGGKNDHSLVTCHSWHVIA